MCAHACADACHAVRHVAVEPPGAVVVRACFCHCRFDHEIPESRPGFTCAALSIL